MSSPAARYFPGVFARRNGNDSHEQTSDASFDRSESCHKDAGVAESEISDEALLFRLQEKDISALGLLYRRYARVVYSVCARLLRDPVEAEDLVHEVFLSLYKRSGTFDPTKGTARSWLVHLTYNKCFDWREYLRARHGFHQGNGESKARGTPPELVEEQDPTEFNISVGDIEALLAKLPREQQLTFQMRVAGYTFCEIAEKLGCSPGNAKHHAYRGIQRLRRIVFDGNKPARSQAAQQRTKLQVKGAFQ
jgi:RNA polymerase sigma-70 factor (ECF subfamily)